MYNECEEDSRVMLSAFEKKVGAEPKYFGKCKNMLTSDMEVGIHFTDKSFWQRFYPKYIVNKEVYQKEENYC